MPFCKHGRRLNRFFEEIKVAYEARSIPPPPMRRGQGVGNVGSELPAKGKGKGKARGEGCKVGPKRALEREATSKPPASSSAKPSSTNAAIARAEKRKRKTRDASADLAGTDGSYTVSFMRELRKTVGGEGWGGKGAVWSLDDLHDEYGTMRTGSDAVLSITSATMRHHVN